MLRLKKLTVKSPSLKSLKEQLEASWVRLKLTSYQRIPIQSHTELIWPEQNQIKLHSQPFHHDPHFPPFHRLHPWSAHFSPLYRKLEKHPEKSTQAENGCPRCPWFDRPAASSIDCLTHSNERKWIRSPCRPGWRSWFYPDLVDQTEALPWTRLRHRLFWEKNLKQKTNFAFIYWTARYLVKGKQVKLDFFF